MSPDAVGNQEIMHGVYRALRTYGFADLTMQDIADECEKSTSLLHYHYDTKEDLLIAFLDHILAEYESRVACRENRPPIERLFEFVARFVFDPADDERESFHRALLEMRSQGPFDERFRSQLDRSDRLLRETVEDILRDGIDEGVFEPVDVEARAALLVATLDGARTRQITLGGASGTDEGLGESYTRTVATAAIDALVVPMLADDATLPSLEETIIALETETGVGGTGR